MITEQDIDDYVALYSATFGLDVSREQAVAQLYKLVSITSCVYKPLPKYEDEYEHSRPTGNKRAV